jgi:membrane protein YdbS with pleckstrin-like domain
MSKDTPESNDEIWEYEDIHFEGQRADEKVLYYCLQHPMIFAPVTLICLISLVIPYFLVRLLDGLPQLIGLIIYAVFLVVYIFYHYFTYNNSESILSSERILSIDQLGFFQKKISEAELERVQDVSTNIKGVIPTFFRYGNVTIRTASNETQIILESIADPYSVQQIIVQAIKNHKRH